MGHLIYQQLRSYASPAELHQPAVAASGTSRRVDVDCLKGIAIVGVVLVHLEYPTRLSSESMAIVHGCQDIFGWCVMAFFFCSGLLTRRIPQTAKEFGLWIGRRVKRLLLPCLVFSIAYKVALIALSQTNLFHWSYAFPANLRGWVAWLLVPASPQFYFLPFLFGISSICCLLLALVRQAWLLWGAATALFLLLGFWSPSQPHGSAPILLIAYAYCYIMGLLTEMVALPAGLWLATNLTLSIAAAVFWQNPFFLYPLAPLILLRVIQKAGATTRTTGLPFLGQSSAAIYVWHAPLLLPFCSVVCHWLLGARLELLQIFFTLGATIALCHAISLIVRRVSWLELFNF
jgi:hypothetical protein